MRTALFTICDYAAVRRDGTVDVVRGGQSLLVVPASTRQLSRSIAFQLFMSQAEFADPDRSIRIEISDADGVVVGSAESAVQPVVPSALSADDDGVERYGVGGALNTNLDLQKEGEYTFRLIANENIVGEQWFAVLHIPEEPAPFPEQVRRDVGTLAQ